MIFTSNEKLPEKESNKKYIFLAGSIDSQVQTNWRKRVTGKLEGSNYILDPTNRKHDELNDVQMKKHIEWELDALSMADKIVLNFLPKGMSPISLVELGLYVATKKLIVVCPKDFYKSRYVFTLCKRYNTPIYHEIDEALNTHFKEI